MTAQPLRDWRSPRSLSDRLIVLPRRPQPRPVETVRLGRIDVEATPAELVLRDLRAQLYLHSRTR
jgi:hypothetical protein